MSLNPTEWFTEIFQNEGTAFSLQIKKHLHNEQSKYQTLDIYDTETFGKLMVIDGCVMLTQRDNFLYHEMMSHPALFTHSQPKNVVIIGGGDCGTLKEVLKHDSVESVVQVDIDERVTRLSEQFFPELCEMNEDPRARLLFDDGIAWMKNAQAGSIDVVIIDSTDPVGPAEGLFAVDFYRDCYRVLSDGGVLVQQSESPLLHAQTIIKNVQQDLKNQLGLPAHIRCHFRSRCIRRAGGVQRWVAKMATLTCLESPLRKRRLFQPCIIIMTFIVAP